MSDSTKGLQVRKLRSQDDTVTSGSGEKNKGLTVRQLMAATEDVGYPVEEAKFIVSSVPKEIITNSGKEGLKFLTRTRIHPGRKTKPQVYETIIFKKTNNKTSSRCIHVKVSVVPLRKTKRKLKS